MGQWGVFVTTPEIIDEQANALVHVEIQNNLSEAVDGQYVVDIYELDKDDVPGAKVAVVKKQLLLKPNQLIGDTVSLLVNSPKRWSLENTNRYLARVSVYNKNKLVDVYDAPFGFRTIQFTHDNGFLLNGKRVQINGTCNHHDLGALGAAVNKVAMERQLRILKSFGCNAIRTSHNPPAPELLELADKMGFLVMDELFDSWTIGKKEYDYSSLYEKWHEKDIEMLICRDRNHPSVILWSTGNELPEQYNPNWALSVI